MKNTLAAVGLMATCWTGTASTLNAQTPQISEVNLKQIAAQLNQQLPMMVNQIIRWDSISAGPGKRLNYGYTVVAEGTLNSKQIAQIQGSVTEVTCNAQEIAILLKNGVVFNYNLRNKSGKPLTTLRVNPSDCGY